MAFIYIISALIIILINFNKVPEAFGIIIDSAFNGTAATGGFAGATVLMAIRFGIARGVFSNEAGLGSAPIAHAAAKTNVLLSKVLLQCLALLLILLLFAHWHWL